MPLHAKVRVSSPGRISFFFFIINKLELFWKIENCRPFVRLLSYFVVFISKAWKYFIIQTVFSKIDGCPNTLSIYRFGLLIGFLFLIFQIIMVSANGLLA